MILTLGTEVSASPVAGWTSCIDVAALGGDPNSSGQTSAISADGRYVAFASGASNLVSGDTNGAFDVFVRDTRAGTTSRVSLTGTGGQVNNHSQYPAISGDGRYVAFLARGTNILAGDPNTLGNVYVRDRVAGTTVRAGPPALSGEADNTAAYPSISADGRYVAFATYVALVPTDTNQLADIYVWARQTGVLERMTVSRTGGNSNDNSSRPDLSADGRYVAFDSRANNLVPGISLGGADVYVRDRLTSTTTRVSVASDGTIGDDESDSGRISGDGRYVLFASLSTNLVPVDIARADVFVHDRVTGTTELVNLDSTGRQYTESHYGGVISADGRYVAFITSIDGVNHVMRRGRLTAATTMVSLSTAGAAADGHSLEPEISADGRGITFNSDATNLVPGGTFAGNQVYLRRYLR
jgi:Tol biopolymer transport system component